MNRSAFVVEMVGPAASGKSTLAGRVVATLRDAGETCVDRADVLHRYRSLSPVRRWSLSVPRSVGEAKLLARTAAFASAAHALRRDSVVRALRMLAVRRTLADAIDASSATVALQDQGAIQSVASIALEGRWPGGRRVGDVANSLAHGLDLVVHCTVDTATAVERLDARRGATSRFDRWSRERVAQVYAAHARQLTELVDCLEGEGVAVVRIEGAASLGANEDLVLANLRGRRYVPSTSGPPHAATPPSGAT